jgi:glycerophosphoryl diester phosphodiesterase
MRHTSLDWLIARPVAHRGLHDAQKGIIENTPSAFAAAIEQAYGIECDLQITADGEAMVYHDDALGRLTEGSGTLTAMTAAELGRIRFRETADRMLTLGELCDLVAGRATLVIELKSRFDDDLRLVRRTADVLSRYAGPAAVMSFDPAPIAVLREISPGLPRGMVAERHYRHHEWDRLPRAVKRSLSCFGHALRTRPQFVAYAVSDLPWAVPTAARRIFGLPLLTWTVRTAADREKATHYADQMIFEGFRP